MPLNKILTVFFILLCGMLNAQDGTIHVKKKDTVQRPLPQLQERMTQVQRNPVMYPCTVCCGGILSRSRFFIELNSYFPVKYPYDAVYKFYPPSQFQMQQGLGVHAFLSGPDLNFYYSRDLFAKLYFVTGFDRFTGREDDSLDVVSGSFHFRYKYDRVPLHFCTSAILWNKDRWLLNLFGDGGGDLLMTRYKSTNLDQNKLKIEPGFGAGLEFYFTAVNSCIVGIRYKVSRIGHQWFREIGLVIPLNYTGNSQWSDLSWHSDDYRMW